VADFSVNILLKANDQATPVIRGLVGQARGLNNAFAGGGARRGQGFFGAANLSSAAAGVQQLTGLAKGAIAAPIELAANFEAAVNRVDAFSGGVLSLEGNLKNVEKEARRLGSSTEFTATQVADGFAILTQAGFTYEQQMDSIGTVVDFATAGQVEMAKSAEVLGSTLGAFSIPAEKADGVADILAKTASKTGSNIVLLGQSMKDVGPIAANLGLGVDQVAAAVGVLGKSFINGGRAGKALKSILLDIDPTKKIGKKLTRALGIGKNELAEALKSGDISAPFRLLENALQKKGLDPAQRNKVLKGIFGKRRASEVSLLLEATKGGLGDERSFAFFQDQLADTDGALDKMATRMRTGVKGSAKELSSALEETGIVIGEQLQPFILELLEDAKEAAREFAKWAKENPELVRTLGKVLIGVVAVGTVLGPVLLALSSFGSLISLGSSLVGGFGAAGLAAAGPYVALAAAAVALGLAIADLIDDMGRLNVEQATLNQLQREGLSIQIGLAKIRGATLLGDLSEADQERLEKLKAKKEKLATELQNVSGTKEFLLGSDAAFFGLEIGDRGSDAIFEDLSKVDAEIDQLNKKGLEAGERRRALETAGGTTSLEKQLLAGGTAGQVDTATLQDTRAAINQAKAAIDALETNQERVDVGGAIDIRVTQEGGVKVSKRKEGAVPIRVDAGPTLEGG
jgi:TP901 family phage tail tape measure protein